LQAEEKSKQKALFPSGNKASEAEFELLFRK
jgi:hypothetical protein